ncbi:unnamed protein product [Rhizoctonia solani]|uniref:Peptidase C14 caspase domain-containing protein n=1 Tax=Rhizoctonia solani TaxID=456999 RepID=A0A8H3E4W6_9AGAM|nr:unnamed protein product [Rhizoctonia solani]
MGLVSTISVVSFSLLVLCTPFALVVSKHPKNTNELASRDHIHASAASNAGQLTSLEVIALYVTLVFAVAFVIAGFRLCIPANVESPQTLSLVTEVHDCSATQIKDSQTYTAERPPRGPRGPSKPTVQTQYIPTYGEKVHLSPTEERICPILDVSTGGSVSKSRGRIDPVVQPKTTDQQPKDSGPDDRLRVVVARPLPRKKSYTRRIHTAPCLSTSDFVFRPPEPVNVLLGSLRGFQLRPVAPSQNTTIHVLAIGLSWNHIKDRALRGPTHDIGWLKKLCADQRQVQFKSLLDEEASFSRIRRSVAHMYMNAQPGDYVVLYFTGHGDGKNAFELYDSPWSLDEVILNDWIVKLRQKLSKHVPVYIIFDFCRESLAKSNAQLDKDVTVIWSCPPGQKSSDVRLSDDLPYSCFLLALLFSIYDSSKYQVSSAVQLYFARRMMELLNFIWGIKCYKPGPLRRKRWCRHLRSCKLCRVEKRGDQDGGEWPDLRLFEALDNMYLGKLPDFETVVRYASTRFPLPIRKAHQLLRANQWFMYFNPSLISTDKGSSTLKTKFLLRDVNIESESALQARGTTLPLGALSTATTTSKK